MRLLHPATWTLAALFGLLGISPADAVEPGTLLTSVDRVRRRDARNVEDQRRRAARATAGAPDLLADRGAGQAATSRSSKGAYCWAPKTSPSPALPLGCRR